MLIYFKCLLRLLLNSQGQILLWFWQDSKDFLATIIIQEVILFCDFAGHKTLIDNGTLIEHFGSEDREESSSIAVSRWTIYGSSSTVQNGAIGRSWPGSSLLTKPWRPLPPSWTHLMAAKTPKGVPVWSTNYGVAKTSSWAFAIKCLRN